jgi:hypothetical protein
MPKSGRWLIDEPRMTKLFKRKFGTASNLPKPVVTLVRVTWE